MVVVVVGGGGRGFAPLAIVEDDDFVHAEDGEGAGDLPRERGFQVGGLGAGGPVSRGMRDGERVGVRYFAIMLPGRAMLSV